MHWHQTSRTTRCDRLPSHCDDYTGYRERYDLSQVTALPLDHEEYHTIHDAAEHYVTLYEDCLAAGEPDLAAEQWPSVLALARRLLVTPEVLEALRGNND